MNAFFYSAVELIVNKKRLRVRSVTRSNTSHARPTGRPYLNSALTFPSEAGTMDVAVSSKYWTREP